MSSGKDKTTRNSRGKTGPAGKPGWTMPDEYSRAIYGGLRTKGHAKKGMPGKPLVTVITAVYNGAKTIDATIRSVAGQTYGNIEYIVIDGGSTDCTLDVIRKNEDRIDLWISEPDRGVYDAMNKGIALASGEWLNFMNSDDRFIDKGAVARAFRKKTDGTDILYGDTGLVGEDGSVRIKKDPTLERIWDAVFFTHQSSFVRTDIYRSHGYDLRYRYTSDYEFFLKCLLEKRRFVYTGTAIAEYSTGGMSNRHLFRHSVECWTIVRRLTGRGEDGVGALRFRIARTLFIMKYFYGRTYQRLINEKLRELLPAGLYDGIKKTKRKIFNRG
ncbi:MAG: glycosyltransferase [Spirochaetes bacterium]|jgi:glycosyltransferase involved in cell wall biosynthesis|nr:glycosyltransferase [Spirochaetota bacterium]